MFKGEKKVIFYLFLILLYFLFVFNPFIFFIWVFYLGFLDRYKNSTTQLRSSTKRTPITVYHVTLTNTNTIFAAKPAILR